MAWIKVTKSKDIQKDLIFMREIALDREFKPTLNENTLKNWASKGLTPCNEIVTNKGTETFENLSELYNLPKSHFYKYLQMRSYLAKEIGLHKTVKEIHPLMACMINISNRVNTKNVLVRFISIVEEEYRSQEIKAITSWEKEPDLTVSPESFSIWRECSWKIQPLFFKTPVIQAMYSKEVVVGEDVGR